MFDISILCTKLLIYPA